MKSYFYPAMFILVTTIFAVATYFDVLPLILLALIAIPCTYLLFKSDWVLLISIVYVYIIDAGNGLFPIPLRELLFLLTIWKLIYYWFTKGYRNKYLLLFLIISVIIPIYGSVISFYRGNNPAFIIDDAKRYIFLLTGLGMACLIYYNNKLTKSLIYHFLSASIIVSLFTIVLFLLDITNTYSLDNTRTLLQNLNLGFAGIEVNGSTRIFLRSHIYVMVSLIFVIGLVFYKPQSRKNRFFLYLSIITFASALLISNTRALWLGSLIGFLAIFFFSKLSYRKIVVYYLSAILIPLSVFLYPESWGKMIERFNSIFDFSNNMSNKIRSIQLDQLLFEFTQYPILGKGFGSTLSTGYYRNIELPYSFELSYAELLYKLGLVGFTVFVISILMIFFIIMKCNNILIKKISLISFICFLIVSFTNPYIVSTLGMFLLSILFAITQNNETKNEAM